MPFPMETDCTLIETYPTISKAIEQSIADTGSIHTADKELERIIANAIKKKSYVTKRLKMN